MCYNFSEKQKNTPVEGKHGVNNRTAEVQ